MHAFVRTLRTRSDWRLPVVQVTLEEADSFWSATTGGGPAPQPEVDDAKDKDDYDDLI